MVSKHIVGSRLRVARQTAGFTRKALAEKTGVTRETIYSTESGRHWPRIDSLQVLAEFLGITLAELFREEDTDEQ